MLLQASSKARLEADDADHIRGPIVTPKDVERALLQAESELRRLKVPRAFWDGCDVFVRRRKVKGGPLRVVCLRRQKRGWRMINSTLVTTPMDERTGLRWRLQLDYVQEQAILEHITRYRNA